jgi:type IV pilus assembly protein PilQ
MITAAAVAPALAPAHAVALVPARAAVTAVSVAPAGSGAGTDVVVHVDRQVEVQDFVLESPYRVVLDLAGTTLGVATNPYDRVARGGVVNVRLSQFRAGVVRVVVELDGRRAYKVERDGNAVRLVLAGAAGEFAPWSAGEPRAQATHVAAAPTTPAPQRAPAPPAAPAAEEVDGAPAAAPVVVEPAREEPRPEPRPTARAEAPRVARVATLPRLTVTYQDADIRDVVAAFAAFSGRTIIVGKEVAGTVTAEVKDQPWDIALRAILQAQGLAASEEKSGIITIDSYKNIASNRAVEPLVTQIVDVNYAKASSLVTIVESLLSRDCGLGTDGAAPAPAAGAATGSATNGRCAVRGAVTADTATNKLLVSDVPSNLPQIVARLQELDVRTPQVAIKAKIIFVNRTGLEDIGVSYDLGSSSQFFQKLVQRIDPSTRTPVDVNGDGVPDALGGGEPYSGDRIALGGNALSAIANADRAVTPSALNLIYSASLGRFALTAFVNALQQTQLADIQSEPSIVTLNNRTAEIFVGQQIPIRVIDASSGGGGGGAGGESGNFPRATVRLEEAGIRLSVTPQVTNNRRIVLNVRAENSNAQVGPSDVGVIFNRQRAENQLLVADGETAVIGGLTVTEKSKSKTGIPFLVDLPLLGRLFGQTTTSEVKRDLLILVTPHILDEGEAAPIPGPSNR